MRMNNRTEQNSGDTKCRTKMVEPLGKDMNVQRTRTSYLSSLVYIDYGSEQFRWGCEEIRELQMALKPQTGQLGQREGKVHHLS